MDKQSNQGSAPGLSEWSKHFEGLRALVVGMGRSGAAAEALLRALGAEVWSYDQKAGEPPKGAAAGEQHYRGLDKIPAEAFEGVGMVVLSPGLDPRPVLAQMKKPAADCRIHGEMSLAMELLHALVPTPPTTTLVTGTNGKSTVTSLIDHLLSQAGHRSFAGGNLGTPLCELLLSHLEGEVSMPEHMVLECSSYQLETATEVPCEVAILLNISPDHLDRYNSLEHYAVTKTNVFRGLTTGGLGMLDGEDPLTPVLAEAVPDHATRLLVTGTGSGIQIGDDQLQLSANESYPRALLRIAGRHNAKNALFALRAARHLGLSVEQCRAGLESFAGLEHRMNFVAEVGGIAYYNDSKATNVAGVLAGLTGFERPFVLIAGGRAKQGDNLAPLAKLLKAHGHGLVAIGESAQSFLDMAKPHVPVRAAGSMQEAVARASELAQAGDAVVLSPACASWDQYKSFAHRGQAFCTAVAELPNAHGDAQADARARD